MQYNKDVEKESENVKKNAKKSSILVAIIIFCILFIIAGLQDSSIKPLDKTYKIDTFSIIASSENKDLEDILLSFARTQNLNINIEYAGTIEIIDKLNAGQSYDAVWTSNSIWLYMLDEDVSIKNSKSTSINPVVFGITKSKAEELGFIDKEVYVKDIVTAIDNKKLKFNMPSVTRNKYRSNSIFRIFNNASREPRNTA